MKLFIKQGLPPGSNKELIFYTEVAADDCNKAKQLAAANDFAFVLQMPDSNDDTHPATIDVDFSSLSDFLQMDSAVASAKKMITDFYTEYNINASGTLSISFLSISSKGQVKLGIHNPAIVLADDLLCGVGISFQAGIRFSAADMNCDQSKMP